MQNKTNKLAIKYINPNIGMEVDISQILKIENATHDNIPPMPALKKLGLAVNNIFILTTSLFSEYFFI